ncbi:ABC transporter ATP-binding protein [Pseudobacteriovorax antillogorgiicola]|uniref:Teichoic acid transport system ATP-binding protein n=1 Tax=Pseudobacteriovorax antillogorgiicola TaxID=1513793 RepID=A0A1Y6CMG7_9BACT|nr:ABC transporter ATP-binding protein [Pseudobacteriovorax antillogorgiicola]TCS45239.1 teichoic acid transport system ATP-binding protein [Pseudobacteriovorax antillogorgiicola]SMF75296.1 teichoic acid transport system ATP-binding protein [Pseudobacteriovorax antillogorgiicola]
MISKESLAVSCVGVSVEYKLPNIRTNTFKEFMINKINGKHRTYIRRALRGVSIEARNGDCIAFIGHNGSGKSTLLKCLAGIIKPRTGSISISGKVAPLIELGAGFDPELTGRENVYLSSTLMGLLPAEVDLIIESIIKFADIGGYFDLPVKTFSSGMYMRLAFACTTSINAQVVLIDEILAVGDDSFQKKCLKRMEDIRNSGATLILVSHDLDTVKQMADKIYVFDEGKIAYEGHPSSAISFYKSLLRKRELDAMPEALRLETLRVEKLQKEKDQNLGKDGKISKVQIGPLTKNSSLVTGEGWFLEIQVEIPRKHKLEPIIGFAINNCHNIRLFGGNTKIFADKISSNDGLSTGNKVVRFEFERLDLASGTYKVTAAIHNNDLTQTIDIRHDIRIFEVIDQFDKDNYDQDLISSYQSVQSLNIANTITN